MTTDIDRELVDRFVVMLTTPTHEKSETMRILCENPREAHAALDRVQHNITSLRAVIPNR